MELNRQQLIGWAKVALSAGGPVSALIMFKTGISLEEYNLYVQAFLSVGLPAIVAVWDWFDNRKTSQIKTVQQLPEVATVVIKDEANGAVGKMARSLDPANANIVTETQNEADAKAGTKVA